ncbi:MAG: alanine racemase [Neomegalonema sp.]|nr:alanine racemase [Neomegalonema sp.]
MTAVSLALAIWRRRIDILNSNDALRADGAEMEINLSAVVQNWRALGALTKGRVGAVLKADAYGLGAAPIAAALDAAGCRDYFVAALSEAEALSQHLINGAAPGQDLRNRRIFVMNGFPPDPRGLAACDAPGPRITPVLHSLKGWRAWTAFWRIGDVSRPPIAALQLETGMNRLGVTLEEAAAITADDLPNGARFLVMSHLASADTPNDPQNSAQRDAFDQALAVLRPKFRQLEASLAATGGLLADAAYHYDLARPGIGLYGGAPFDAAAPVVSLSAPILRIWDAAPGAKVGYNGTWRAQDATRLATVAIGYADGLPRALSNNGVAYIGDAPAPIVGRVSMDLTVLDISKLGSTPSIGDRAMFLDNRPTGPSELRIDAMAQRVGAIGYEILTKLGPAPRVVRRYSAAPTRA